MCQVHTNCDLGMATAVLCIGKELLFSRPHFQVDGGGGATTETPRLCQHHFQPLPQALDDPCGPLRTPTLGSQVLAGKGSQSTSPWGRGEEVSPTCKGPRQRESSDALKTTSSPSCLECTVQGYFFFFLF